MVSVVMPTFNRAHMVEQAIRCVLAQPIDLELVVIDDGSTDRTRAAVGAVGDNRVRYLYQDNAGLCPARNAGLAEASGRWVAFVDDDDLWGPRKLASQLAALDDQRAEWCIVAVVITDDEFSPIMVQPAPSSEQVGPGLRRGNVVPGGGSGAVVERRALVEIGGFDESLWHLGDWELWTRLAARGAPAVVEEPQLLYRRHRGQMSRALDEIAAEVAVLADRGLVDADARAAWLDTPRPDSSSSAAMAARVGRMLLERQAAELGPTTIETVDSLVADVRSIATSGR